MKNEELKKEILSPTQSVGVGAAAGAVQTVASLWLWTMKVRVQCHYPFTLNPYILYKGFTPALASIALMSTLQVLLTTTTHRIFHRPGSGQEEDKQSFSERCFSALTGGASATLVSNPVGVVITQQHKAADAEKQVGFTHLQSNKNTFTQVGLRLMKKQGVSSFYVSFGCNCVINSVFTFSFYALYPWLKRNFSDYYQKELPAVITAGTSMGLFAGLTLQPIDTIKTMQEEGVNENRLSVRQCVLEIYKNRRGIRGFYAGFWAASAATAAASTVAAIFVDKAEAYFSGRTGPTT